MSTTRYSLQARILSSQSGYHTESFVEGSLLVGVCANGNCPAVVYWSPEEGEYVNTTLYICSEGESFDPHAPYGACDDNLPLTPQRLRYLGAASVDNGTEVLHVFQVQPARSYPFDAAL